MSHDRIEPFTDDQGLINEFALMYNVKDSFPLHYIVFKQTAVHIPDPARGECRAGLLHGWQAGVCSHSDPRHLARMVMIACNKKIYKPESKNLLSKYFQKFSKAGKLEFEEETLGLELDGIQECDDEE